VTFLVIRNGTYQVLLDYRPWLHASGLPAMNLPGIDFVSLARGYGVPARRVETASVLTDARQESFAGSGPTLIEAVVQAAPSGMF
jgi:benzoylformate decarboxylase